MCISVFFNEIYFSRKIRLESPTRSIEECNLIKTGFCQMNTIPKCIKHYYHAKGHISDGSKLCFDQIDFFNESCGGLQPNFPRKKYFIEVGWNAHQPTQLFTLIPNMLFVFYQVLLFSLKIGEKSEENTKSRIRDKVMPFYFMKATSEQNQKYQVL